MFWRPWVMLYPFLPALVDDGHLGDQVRDVKLSERAAEALGVTAVQSPREPHQLPLDTGWPWPGENRSNAGYTRGSHV